jgi:hypothetical protein
MEVFGNEIKQKLSNKFYCEKCKYKTDRKCNFQNHINSTKHLMEMNGTVIKQQLSDIYECDICNKIYQTSAGLWKHKKTCKCDKHDKNNFDIDANIVVQLLKQNDEFKNLLIEQNKQIMQSFQDTLQEVCKNGINNHSNNMTNSHNKAFNLQFFLNETCKDAMNISEFVDSLTLQLSDLENVGKLGFVEGMSNIIIENMKLLDISKRPIHCMDTKREVMYLKDKDTWEKTSDDDNKKIRRAIKQIATKNVKNLRLFKEKHPDCINYNSKYSDQYLKLQTESCGGKHPDYENESKIIKRLAKVMAVDKSL